MRQQFEFYENLIKNVQVTQFWDLVVITAINQQQKNCYDDQIRRKLANRQLPSQFEYLVLNDPDGCKIGSGGSTLNTIRILHERYSDKLYSMKILLIHAGGYSQRMPPCTVLRHSFFEEPPIMA